MKRYFQANRHANDIFKASKRFSDREANRLLS